MKYVLDSSVALKWVLPESDSSEALALLGNAQSGVHQLIAPDVFPIEVGHALTRSERAGRVSPPDGWMLWQSVMADAPLLHESLALMPQAYALSSQMRIGLYDCLYVALAEQQQCELVTADQRLIAAFNRPFIIDLASL